MTMCIDRKEVYMSLYKDIEKEYFFNFSEFSTNNGVWNTFRYVINMIRRVNPDVVLVSECGLISIIVVLYRLLTFRKYRIVSIIDDSYNMLVDDNQFTKRHEMAEKLLIPFFDEVINVEPRVADYFRKRYGKGVTFPIIRIEEDFRSELSKSLPIASEYIEKFDLEKKIVILFVGRFVAIKNVVRLIKCVQSINDERIRLVLVGAGPEEKKYRKIASPIVIFAGQQTGLELLGWYNVAHILVLPSTQEAFGAVVNEALLAGCKCLVSNRAGSSCLIVDGLNGECCDPIDDADIKNKLIHLINGTPNLKINVSVKHSLMQTTFEKEFSKILKII